MSSNNLSTSDGFLNIIQNIAEKKENLTLTSSFKGLSLNQRANVDKIQKEQIYLRINDFRIFSSPAKQVILHHHSFTKPIQASFQKSCWVNEGVLILSQLAYKDADWVARAQERVQPKAPIYVNFRYKGKPFRGDLENIAIDGMGMLVDRFFEKEIDLQASKKISLCLILPPDLELANLSGTIINLQTICKNLMRLGIRLLPRPHETSCLKAYVAQRKAEILEELDQVLFECYEPEDVFGLYF
jgi:hypothetical protein